MLPVFVSAMIGCFSKKDGDFCLHKWDPDEYEKSSSAQKQWAMEVVSKIGIRGDERVLDVGCGDGKITAWIAGLVPAGSALGIDLSEDMITFARRAFPPDKCQNLSFKVADARSLPFEEEFDLVVSFAALHWILDQQPVLEGIWRSLKPGGSAFLQFGGRGNAAGILKFAEGMMQDAKWSRYFKDFEFPYGFFEAEEYRAWIEDAGLKAVRVELIPKDMVLSGRKALASWVKTTWLPYLEQVPVDKRDKFVNEVVDRYLQERPLDSNGDVHVDMMRLEAVAEK